METQSKLFLLVIAAVVIMSIFSFIAVTNFSNKMDLLLSKQDELIERQTTLEKKLNQVRREQDHQNDILKQFEKKIKAIEKIAREAKLTICNPTLAKVFAVVAMNSGSTTKISGYYAVPVGECLDLNLNFNWNNAEKRIYVHGSSYPSENWIFANKIVNGVLSSHDQLPFNVSLGDEVKYHGNHSYLNCIHPSDSFKRTSTEHNVATCDSPMVVAGFTEARKTSKSRKRWIFVFNQPNTMFYEIDKKEVFLNLDDGLDFAKTLNKSISFQIEADEYFDWGRQPLARIGADLLDNNGKLGLGITVSNVIPTDIFGDNQMIQNNDVIVGFNEYPIFSIDEFTYHLDKHAKSLKGGAGVPVKLNVIRSTCPDGCILQTRFFFNQIAFSTYKPVGEIETMYLGALNEWSFGLGSHTHCLAKNLGKLTGNILFGVFEGISSLIEKRSFNKYSLQVFEYDNHALCSWLQEQRKALASQFNNELYQNSAYAGLFSPGALRFAISKVGKKTLLKGAKKSRLARGISDGIIEAFETGVSLAATAAPGTSAQQRLNDALVFMPWGGGIGFATGVLGGVKK